MQIHTSRLASAEGLEESDLYLKLKLLSCCQINSDRYILQQGTIAGSSCWSWPRLTWSRKLLPSITARSMEGCIIIKYHNCQSLNRNWYLAWEHPPLQEIQYYTVFLHRTHNLIKIFAFWFSCSQDAELVSTCFCALPSLSHETAPIPRVDEACMKQPPKPPRSCLASITSVTILPNLCNVHVLTTKGPFETGQTTKHPAQTKVLSCTRFGALQPAHFIAESPHCHENKLRQARLALTLPQHSASRQKYHSPVRKVEYRLLWCPTTI